MWWVWTSHLWLCSISLPLLPRPSPNVHCSWTYLPRGSVVSNGLLVPGCAKPGYLKGSGLHTIQIRMQLIFVCMAARALKALECRYTAAQMWSDVSIGACTLMTCWPCRWGRTKGAWIWSSLFAHTCCESCHSNQWGRKWHMFHAIQRHMTSLQIQLCCQWGLEGEIFYFEPLRLSV